MKAALREIRPTLTLALPIIVGQVSQMLMGVTDSVMIGRAGTVPLAASAFGSTVFNVFYVVGIGLMLPVSIFVSRARGATRPDEAGEYLRHGMALAWFFGLLETLAMVGLGTQLARFGQPPEVLAVVTPFFLLIAGSITSVFVYLVLRQFAEAMGHPWAPMFIMLIGVGLNAALNWVFIYGNLGLPALGLTGAGISTLVSRLLGAVVIFVWLRRDPAVRAAWPQRWWGGYSRARFVEMLRLGLPASGMLLFETTAFGFSCVMIGWLGANPLAAHQIAITSASLAFMFPLGLSMAAGMRVSRAVGAGELARRRPIAFGAIGLGIAITGLFGIAFWVAGRQIAMWFVDDPAVIVLAAQLLAVGALFQIVDGVQVIGAACLRGISDVKVPTLITFAAYWVVALPLGYLLGVRGPMGAVGMWIGIASGLALAAMLLTGRFARLTR
ncbi:MAG: MATE family efflux transporter [Verrucomicrobia bacterium]|nr:MATE family efflux transporter [Verrucomicrobiota bacterium]